MSKNTTKAVMIDNLQTTLSVVIMDVIIKEWGPEHLVSLYWDTYRKMEGTHGRLTG